MSDCMWYTFSGVDKIIFERLKQPIMYTTDWKLSQALQVVKTVFDWFDHCTGGTIGLNIEDEST